MTVIHELPGTPTPDHITRADTFLTYYPSIEIPFKATKEQVFDCVRKFLAEHHWESVPALDNFEKPWGGYFVIHDDFAQEFVNTFFPTVTLPEDKKISPKILVVNPEAELSWQVHERRAEEWYVLHGPIYVYSNHSDAKPERPDVLKTGDSISLYQGMRHALAGTRAPGVVAEIWVHTDLKNDSNEDDIRRISDIYGRT